MSFLIPANYVIKAVKLVKIDLLYVPNVFNRFIFISKLV